VPAPDVKVSESLSSVSPLCSDLSPVLRDDVSSSSVSPSLSLVAASNVLLSSFFSSSSRRAISSTFFRLRDAIPPSPTNPYTPLQLAGLWLSEQYTQNPFVCLLPDIQDSSSGSAFLYKKVANKTRPVATTLPENFRVVRYEHPDPLAGMQPLPARPPDFTPNGRFTRERRDRMAIGKDFLLPEEVKLAEWIIGAHDTAFAWTDEERGCWDPKYFAPVEIPHVSHVPWVLRQGPIPRGILHEVIKIIEDKWRSGVYEPSSSSYNSRWFCVIKKDGKSLRLVHSLEPLNAVTIRNSAMPPYIEVVAEDFAGRSVYSTLDLYVSFDQRQLHERSRDMTTFNTPLGSLRLAVLPMGWTSSPAILQGDITHALRPEIPHNTQPIADDTPIGGPKTRYELPDGSFETIPENPGIRRFVWEHLEVVNRIIQRVKAYGATFSGKKTFIGIDRADVLGHLCTYEGRIADPSRIKVIEDWPVPTNVSEVRAFLGTCGVLRIFIKGYTLVARPLIRLTRKDEPFEIGPAQLDAIAKIKLAVINSPALRPIDYESDLPVILAVDSCANGTGYILLQIGEDGKRYPSRFGSITFNDRESRYSQAKLELYGLFRSLKHTQLYTIGVKKLVVEMDAKFIKGMINNPTLHPNDAINRWIAAILLFDFELVHVPADKHTGADGLSRRPAAPEDPVFEDADELDDWIDSNAGLFIESSSPPHPYDFAPPLSLLLNSRSVFSASLSSPSVPPPTSRPSSLSVSPPSSRSPSPDLEIPRSVKAINREAKLSVIRRFLVTLERPEELSDDKYRLFIRQAMDYFMVDSKMFRKNRGRDPQLVPNPPDRLRLIQYAHDHLGHKGVFATTRNLLLRFWWPHLNEDVRWYIRTCHDCQVRQTEYFYIPPTVPEVPSLFRKAHIDTFLMPKAGSYRYVHHARDALTSYPEGRAATSDSGKVIADFIFQDILCRWGGIEEIVTDNAPPYIAALDVLASRYGIRHIRVSGYNSQANGIVESKHFDVREAIIKTCLGNESKWREVLPQVFWAERVTIRRATGYSPYYMVHGTHPLLPFDIYEATYLAPTQDFGMSTEELIGVRARQLAKRPGDLSRMQDLVTDSRRRNLERFEQRHASRIIDFDFELGALVLVRNTRVEESLNRKTKPRYLGPMVVVRKTPGTSYIVAELDGAQSELRVAGFRLVPYFPRSFSSLPIVSGVRDDDDFTVDDPHDVSLFSSHNSNALLYTTVHLPFLR
jgi:transposase InsO family protein